MQHKDIIKKNSPTSLIISLSLIVVGILMTLILNFKVTDIIGVFMMFGGIFSLFFIKKVYIYAPTGSVVTQNTLYYNPSERTKLKEILDSARFDLVNTLKISENGIRLDLLLSKNNDFAAAQILEYVPHKYVESSRLYEYFGEDAKKAIESFKEVPKE